MAAMRQNPASPSRFSWFTFGKSTNASLDRAHENELDDPWYIPYSGPIEPPREPFRRRLERDSWGDPIERDEEEGTTHVRQLSETESDIRHPFARGSQVPVIGTDSQTGRRVRTQSTISGRTNSSRASILSPRRLTITTTQRLPVPQPTSGGVGESPVPPPMHHRTFSKERNGIAGLLSFGGQTRKKASEKEPKLFSKMLEQSSSRLSSAGHRRSASTGSNLTLGYGNLGNGDVKVAGNHDHSRTLPHFARQVPQKTGDNVGPGASNQTSGTTSSLPRREQQMSTLYEAEFNTRHPYSYVLPSLPGDIGPQTALLPSTHPIASTSKYATAPTLTFPDQKACPQKFTGIAQEGIKGLKNSASTPVLRVGSVPKPASQLRTKTPPTHKMKERWLSAETWCDALLFPRPRLKMKKAGDMVDAGRIVSLPPSPVKQSGHSGVPEQGIASRVLAHSRSLADLDNARKGPHIKELGISSWSTGLRPHINPPKEAKRRNQQRNWAFDDLALPTPVPSLAQVLEEGEKFENQRKQWQDQATKSFQNKRSRSISRSRSKSLNRRLKNDRGRPSNIDVLAASACLGNQILTPVVAEDGSNSSKLTSFATGPLTRTSRSHSDHANDHWRPDLFGRTASKKAKPVEVNDPDGREFLADNQLENALKEDGTKIIRLADPALALNSALTSGSPTSPVSYVNDTTIGIALTTPFDNPDDIETTRLSPHPYAQGGLYSFNSTHPVSGVADYHVPGSPVKDLSKQTDRNLPLNANPCVTGGHIAISSYHPYAHKSSLHDAYLPDTKNTHSDVSAPSRMWAQLSSGNIREVYPDDIQYSPFIGNEPEADDFIRNSRVINDTVGIGEALAFAASSRASNDSGLGTSEEHFTADPSYRVSAQALKQSSRQPVQYDITRTPNFPLQTTDHDSAHTFASSPLLHQQQSASNVLHNTMHTVQTIQTNASPESFSRSLRSISDPDDLEGFYGLFYDPNRSTQHMASQMTYTSTSDGQSGMRRRVESELASLARQLSQELEQMTLEQEGRRDLHSSMRELQSSVSRKLTSSTLEFVFEETSSPVSETTGLSPPCQHTIPPFQPSSANVPEDVELSRASSLIDPSENVTEFRVGLVNSTPIADVDPQVSLIDKNSLLVEHDSFEQENSLQPRMKTPSTDPTRSSYTTSSTMSRMSTLSDFPVPPPRHAVENMSISTSYFNRTHLSSEPHDSRATTTPLRPDGTIADDLDDHSSGEEIEELVAALSSHSHSTVRHN